MRLFSQSGGSGSDLVLIHGWGIHSAIWEALAEQLKPHFRVTCIDLPGHGRSGYLSRWGSLEAWAEACLDAAPAQAVWAGWSLGALIAMAASFQAPQRITGLVSIAGTPRFVTAENWPGAVPLGTLDQFSAQLHEDYRGTLERFLALQVRGSESTRETLRRLRKAVLDGPEPNSEALAVGLALLRESDLREQVGRCHLPCLWLLGERDLLVPASLARDLRRLIPQSRIQLIKGAGHAPMLSHLSETVRAIRGFVE